MKFTTKHKLWIHRFLIVLFMLYIAAMAYLLFFSEQLNRTNGNYEYNLVLLKEIKRGFWCYRNGMKGYFLLNVVMNVVAFMPFGFLLPLIHSGHRKFSHIVFLGFEMTLFIELVQLLLRVGSFDVDDILLNMTGAILGFLLFKLLSKPEKKGEENAEEK